MLVCPKCNSKDVKDLVCNDPNCDGPLENDELGDCETCFGAGTILDNVKCNSCGYEWDLTIQMWIDNGEVVERGE